MSGNLEGQWMTLLCSLQPLSSHVSYCKIVICVIRSGSFLTTNYSFLVDDGSMCWKLLEETGLVGRLEEGLAAEPVEWKRSFGRTAKSVTVRAKLAQSADHFRALQDQAVPTKLIGHPVLHTFWTDCQDLDAYKSGVAGSVKDEISRWLQMLKQVWGSSTASESWMVVVVETNSQVQRHNLPCSNLSY